MKYKRKTSLTGELSSVHPHCPLPSLEQCDKDKEPGKTALLSPNMKKEHSHHKFSVLRETELILNIFYL